MCPVFYCTVLKNFLFFAKPVIRAFQKTPFSRHDFPSLLEKPKAV